MTTGTTTAPRRAHRPNGEPITARDAAQEMLRIQAERRGMVGEYRRLGRDAARKRADAVKAKARAQLTSHRSTVEDRKAEAAEKSADDFYEADVAEVLVDACKQALWVLKDDWDTYRSIGANERAEKNALEGFGS